MDNFNDLKSIWLTAKTDALPSSAQIVRLVKKFRNKILFKKLLVIIVACLLIVAVAAVTFFSGQIFIIDRIANVLVIASAAVLAFTNIRSIKRFYNLQDCSNVEFLQFLEQTRKNQIYYYRKTQVVSMLFSSAALLLYIYELTLRYKNLSIALYMAAIAYLLIMWFVVRPRAFKKSAAQLNATKQNMERILKQLE